MNETAHEDKLIVVKHNMAFWVQLLIILTLFVFCYQKVFKVLIGAWWHNSAYSHGFLVPFISLYLIWIQREKLRALSPAPNYLHGILVLYTGLLILIAGHAGRVIMIQEISIIITLLGIILLVLGVRFLYALLFPILYLSFMIRFWGSLTTLLHLPFQNLSANLGAMVIQAVGIPAFRHSTYIYLPNITLEVAEVCSGVNYLIAVVAIGIPLAYVAMNSWHRRIILVAGAVVIAALGNSLRVGLIGILAYYGVTETLHGPMHVLQAMFVSVIGYIVLFVGAYLMSGNTTRNEFARRCTVNGQILQNGIRFAPMLITALALILAGSYITFYSPVYIHLKKNLSDFPYHIENWTGLDSISSDGYDFDQKLSRVYRDKSGKGVELNIGYYEHQEQGRELVGYKNKIQNEMTGRLNFPEGISVNKVVQKSDKSHRITLFWYEINGRSISNMYLSKVYTTIDYFFYGRTNGALIFVAAEITEREDEAVRGLTGFIKVAQPFIRDYLQVE